MDKLGCMDILSLPYVTFSPERHVGHPRSRKMRLPCQKLNTQEGDDFYDTTILTWYSLLAGKPYWIVQNQVILKIMSFLRTGCQLMDWWLNIDPITLLLYPFETNNYEFRS